MSSTGRVPLLDENDRFPDRFAPPSVAADAAAAEVARAGSVAAASDATAAKTDAEAARDESVAAAERAEAVPAQVDTAMADLVGTGGEFDTKLNATIGGFSGEHTADQTIALGKVLNLAPGGSTAWNTSEDIVKIGPDLLLQRHQGNAGQRLALTGQDDTVMPYYEVVATTRTGTDGGAAVAGYQLHLGPDGGQGNNREFFYIEAAGELHGDGPHFRIGTHASGTGTRRSLRIESRGSASFVFPETVDNPEAVIEARKPIHFKGDLGVAVKAVRTGGNFTVLNAMTYAAVNTITQTFLGASAGTEDAPTPLAGARVLGSHTFGSVNASKATVLSAQIRAVTNQAWELGVAHGTRLELHLTRNGATAQVEALRVADPASNQAGMMVLINRSGTVTLSQVTIGDADSAGTGFRVLRVAN